jgi:hypothetical protein
MELPATVFVAGGAIVASFITGIFAFTSMLTSKDQKTSEFRQDWINSVRKEISIFTCSVADYTSHRLHKGDNNDAWDKFLNENIDLTNQITRSYNSLRLYLNKVDDAPIVKVIDDLYKYAALGDLNYSVEDVTKKENELISLIQDMLKTEWQRVKRGEVSYRMMKWGGLALIIIPLVATSIHYQEIIAVLKLIRI